MRARVQLGWTRQVFGGWFGFPSGFQVKVQRFEGGRFDGFFVRGESAVPGGAPKGETLSDLAIRRSDFDSCAFLEDCLIDV